MCNDNFILLARLTNEEVWNDYYQKSESESEKYI